MYNMTKKAMLEELRKSGVKKEYRPYQEPESNLIFLKTKIPWDIVDGLLVGGRIYLYEPNLFWVWTPHVKRARRIAKEYNLEFHPMEGECDLMVPGHLADEILPKFGAKVKRQASPQTLLRLRRTAFKSNPCVLEPRRKALPPQEPQKT